MTIREMESNAAALVSGGSETIATLLSGTCFQLLCNPQIMEKVVSEVHSAFQTEADITIDSANNLSYLINVLSEAMRIYPPVPTFSARVVPDGGDTVDGKYLPGGTMVHMCMFAAFHLSSNFKRPEEFLPERWSTEGMEGEFKEDKRDVCQPFSVGPRNCIGKVCYPSEYEMCIGMLTTGLESCIC